MLRYEDGGNNCLRMRDFLYVISQFWGGGVCLHVCQCFAIIDFQKHLNDDSKFDIVARYIKYFVTYGGFVYKTHILEYLHHSPASRKSQQKGNQV
jgi:hypothetical protein